MVGALFCPIWQIFPVWFHCIMFGRLCCFRLTTALENCHSDTLHNISRHNLATVFWNICVKSILWPALISNVVDVSLSGGRLGYWTACNRVGQSREIYSNSVPLLLPHWPYPKRIRPPSWPRVAVASSIQNTKLFTWRTWPGAGAVPKCDWAARSLNSGAPITQICCDAWPIRFHYWTDDCINMFTRMTMHYFKCNRMENDNTFTHM